MDEHLGYGKSEHADREEVTDYRNGTKKKQVNSGYGSMTIDVPQDRPLYDVYPVLYIDAIHYSVREDGMIHKLAAYVILGINIQGKKKVLTIEIGENESSKYWLSVLNRLKNLILKIAK